MGGIFNEFKFATELVVRGAWRGVPHGELFFCAFCGHKFQVGDEYMLVYTNDTEAWGNPITCRHCFEQYDGIEGLRREWHTRWAEYRTRFIWWYAGEKIER